MPLDRAWAKALEDLRGLNPRAVAARAGVPFEAGRFALPFFNRAFLISHPEAEVVEPGAAQPPAIWLKVLCLHYLIQASGVPVADQWVTYRHLPGAGLFERRFQEMAIRSLAQAFGQNIQGFHRACQALGGAAMSRTGDAAYRFLAFPHLPLACLLYLGDEEVAPSAAILFDAAAPHYLPTEDLSLVGTYLSGTLRRLTTIAG